MGKPDIDEVAFRQILGNYPTGVTLVSVNDNEGPFAMVIGSFGSVSLDPVLVQFMPAKNSKTWERIAATGSYCVNVLNEKQLELSNSFFDKSKDPFDSIEWRKEATGSPVIKDCVAWVDCSIGDIHDAGDHYIVIGEVQRIGSENQKDGPLLFLGGSYGSFTELTGS